MPRLFKKLKIRLEFYIYIIYHSKHAERTLSTDPRNVRGSHKIYFSVSSWARNEVARRTFGWRSVNIATPRKSENCQDNFRDLLRSILSFWLKSNILCCVGFKYNLFVDPSLRRGLLLVRLFSPNTVEKRFGYTRVCCFVSLSFTISPCSAQDDRLNRV